MDRLYSFKLKSPAQTVTPETYKPPLPERFRITGCLRLDEKLWIYEVFDQYEGHTARLWLEEVYRPLEEHHTRALALKKLSHKNIWPVYDHLVLTIEEKQYFAIIARAPGADYVTSRTLFAGSINLIVVGQLIRQVALALNYCHSQEVLHSHLEPMFIWVGLDGTVRLELFSALANRRQNLLTGEYTTFTQMLSSAAYSSPEQLGTRVPWNVQTEIYSLGLIAYEMLVGFNPFLASSDMASRLRHVYKAVPPLHEINLQVGPALETAIMLALTKNPDGRYARILDFLADFEVGLARNLQTLIQPLVDFNIEQLIQNHKLVARQVESFLSETIQKPDIAGEMLPSKELPAGEVKEKPVIELNAAAAVEPLPPAVAEPTSTKSTSLVRQPAPAAKPARNPLKPRPQIVVQPARLKWNVLIPWLLILNLFFMGFLAWLLLNTPNTTNSELLYTANPPTRFPVPTVDRRPSIVPVSSRVTPPQTSGPDLTETPPANDFSSIPPINSTITDPHVLTALAPTVTPDADENNNSENTVSLTPEELSTPAERLTPEPFITDGPTVTTPAALVLKGEIRGLNLSHFNKQSF